MIMMMKIMMIMIVMILFLVVTVSCKGEMVGELKEKQG
jgi:type III secretory pathway lipoprotein EscJ